MKARKNGYVRMMELVRALVRSKWGRVMARRCDRLMALAIAGLWASIASAGDAPSEATSPKVGHDACASLGAGLDRSDPVALYDMGLTCHGSGHSDKAAMYFDLARLYGVFDANRVPDTTAHQIGLVLMMQAADTLGTEGVEAVGGAQQRMHADQAALAKECAVFRQIGPPKYEPEYMINHGMGGLLGSPSPAKPLDDAQSRESWEATLERFCSLASPARNGMAASRFSVEEGEAWMNWPGGKRRIEGVDLDTFELVKGNYTRDRQHVFYGEKIVEGADPASFRVLGEQLGADAKRVYFESSVCTSCDPATIRQSRDWFVDAKSVYREGEGGLVPFQAASASGFTVINGFFAKDDESVFLSDSKIIGADAPSFGLAKCGECQVCGEDKNRCYWFDRPTACDCGDHSGADFVMPAMRVPEHGGIVSGGPFDIDFEFKGLPADLRIQYRALAAGSYTLPVSCWNTAADKKESLTVPLSVEEGGFYALEGAGDSGCVPVVRRPVLVLGQQDDPQISLKIGDKLEPEAVMPADTQSITVACYKPTKKKAFQREVTVPVLLKAGTIYQLRGIYDTAADRCNVFVEPRRSGGG